VVPGLSIGRLVVVDDHRREASCSLVGGDVVQLPTAEVGEQHRISGTFRDGVDLVAVQLVFEHRLELDARSHQHLRGNRCARQPVRVDMRRQQHVVGVQELACTRERPV